MGQQKIPIVNMCRGHVLGNSWQRDTDANLEHPENAPLFFY